MKKLTINIETLIFHIANMKAEKFVKCVNKYTIDTKYNVLEDDKVCELKDEKVINILAPEYFGISSNKMRIDHLKKVYLRNIENAWATMEKEDQELVFLEFC